jgi:hypothetical protein
VGRQDKLVPIAEFATREIAEQAWGRLADAGIPANVETDPGPLGASPLARIYVARRDVEPSQRLIADLTGS